jgi:hypothetical protein
LVVGGVDEVEEEDESLFVEVSLPDFFPPSALESLFDSLFDSLSLVLVDDAALDRPPA